MKRFAGLWTALVSTTALAATVDPPVPPGRDPGGYKVAIVGGGIDYTLPHLANMLARDGEGEIIGYDFIDDDRRPFAAIGDTAAAEIVTGEGQAATLAPIRANWDGLVATSRAIAYAAATPTKVVLLTRPLDSKATADLVSSAAVYFDKKLFVVPVAGGATDIALKKRANLIAVAASEPQSGASAADIAAPVHDVVSATDASPRLKDATPETLAAARIAALASRLQAVETELPPAGMKDRILGLAEPAAADAATGPRIITQPRRHFWLE